MRKPGGTFRRSIGGAPVEIQQRHIDHCTRADPAYGAGVAKALGIEEGLRIPARGQAFEHRVEVTAQQGDVEHGKLSGSGRHGRADRRRSGG